MKSVLCREAGVALLHVLILLTLLIIVSGGAAMLARVEARVSYFHRGERDAAYAAEAILAATLLELDRVADWNTVLSGAQHAAFADGAVEMPKRIPGAGTVDVCCASGSMTARAQAETGLPWRAFGWQSLSALLNDRDAPRQYLVAWVVDDPDEADGDPLRDSNGRIAVRAEAVTPLGARKALVVIVERARLDPVTGTRPPGLHVLSWREER